MCFFLEKEGSSFFSVTSPVKCKTTAPIKSSKPQGVPGSAAPCTELQLGECGLGRPSKSQNAEKSSSRGNERKSEILTWITLQKAAAKELGISFHQCEEGRSWDCRDFCEPQWVSSVTCTEMGTNSISPTVYSNLLSGQG